MLTEAWRQTAELAGAGRGLDRKTQQADTAFRRMLHLGEHADGVEMGIVQQLLGGEHLAEQDVRCQQVGDPVPCGPARHSVRDQPV